MVTNVVGTPDKKTPIKNSIGQSVAYSPSTTLDYSINSEGPPGYSGASQKFGTPKLEDHTSGKERTRSPLVFEKVPPEMLDSTTQTDKSKQNRKKGMKIVIETPASSHKTKKYRDRVERENYSSSDGETLSRPPRVKPPQNNKTTLYKSPKVFNETDRRAMQVRFIEKDHL